MFEASVVEHRDPITGILQVLMTPFGMGEMETEVGGEFLYQPQAGRGYQLKCKVCVRQFLLFFTILSNQS